MSQDTTPAPHIPTLDALPAETIEAARLTVVEMCPDDARTVLDALGIGLAGKGKRDA